MVSGGTWQWYLAKRRAGPVYYHVFIHRRRNVFRPVSAELDFVALEEAELARWKKNDVFNRSMAQREGAEPWVFYEGPPTANGKPGLHHVWARVYKDLFCRYQTMQGRFVARRAGWDTHGLPVEVQVEKQLGISGKMEIVEQVGI
jgi:isoleucyl-tRNA synthetase